MWLTRAVTKLALCRRIACCCLLASEARVSCLCSRASEVDKLFQEKKWLLEFEQRVESLEGGVMQSMQSNWEGQAHLPKLLLAQTL